MRPPPRKSFSAARLTVPGLVSIALHAFLVFALWHLPAEQTTTPANVDPTQAPAENECKLALDDRPPHRTARRPTQPPGGNSIQQTAFEVKLVEPPVAPPPLPKTLTAGPGLPSAGLDAPGASPGGIGGATGRGNGSSSVLKVGASARSVVYVVDRSISMGFHGALARARREILASLRSLGPSTRFQVIAYNSTAEPLRINGQVGLLPSDENTRQQAADAVSHLRAAGKTDHGLALRRAIALQPDLIYFLTDDDDVTLADVETATRLARHGTVINTIEINQGRPSPMNGPLRKLAAATGGAYQRLDPEN